MDSQQQINKMVVNHPLHHHHNIHHYFTSNSSNSSNYCSSGRTPPAAVPSSVIATTTIASSNLSATLTTKTNSNIECNSSVNNNNNNNHYINNLHHQILQNQYNCINSSINNNNNNNNNTQQQSTSSTFSYNKKRSRDSVDIEQLGITASYNNSNSNNNSFNNSNNSFSSNNSSFNSNNNSFNNNNSSNNNNTPILPTLPFGSTKIKDHSTRGGAAVYSTSPLSNSFTGHFYNDDEYNEDDDHGNVKIFKSRKDDNDKNIVPTSPHLYKSLNSPFSLNLSTSPHSSVPLSPLLIPPTTPNTSTPRYSSTTPSSTPRLTLPLVVQTNNFTSNSNIPITPTALQLQYHLQLSPISAPPLPSFKPIDHVQQQQQQQSQIIGDKQELLLEEEELAEADEIEEELHQHHNQKQNEQFISNELQRFEQTFGQLKIFEEEEPELIELNSSWNEQQEMNQNESVVPPRVSNILNHHQRSFVTRQPYQLSPIESVVVRSRNPMAPFLLYGSETRFANSQDTSSSCSSSSGSSSSLSNEDFHIIKNFDKDDEESEQEVINYEYDDEEDDQEDPELLFFDSQITAKSLVNTPAVERSAPQNINTITNYWKPINSNIMTNFGSTNWNQINK